MYHDRGVLACCYYTYFADLPTRGFEVYGRGRRAIGLMPTNDGLVCAFQSWPREEFATFRADIEGKFLATCDVVPELGQRVRAARRAERFYGTANLPNFFRTPYGPGWALVGDAGYVLDPVTGQGIGDAFRDAELLAEAIGSGDFAGYERKRNKAALPMFELTTDLASYQPPEPRKVAVLRALVGNQEQTDRFFGVLTGTVPIPEFFGPVNLLRILGPVGLAKLMVAA
jgi:2-polyprenyl-6-methoxyphenol hydroxylase-like FAD-dependent oxidoreductase